MSTVTSGYLDMPATTPRWLEAAVAAPSVHNTQPWLFEVDGPLIKVRADLSRQLRVVDPAARQLTMSVAAAGFNLRLAIRAHGRVPVHSVLPEPGVVLSVVPGANSRPRAAISRLRAAVPARRTNRMPFEETPPARAALREMFAAAAVEGADLLICPPLTRADLVTLTRAAEARLAGDPAYRAEIGLWAGGERNGRDGIPEGSFGVRDAGLGVPIRTFGPVPAAVRFEDNPVIAVLTTAGDAPRDWVCAGQALQRVLLTATLHGLAATPLNQALEVPDLRRRVNARFPGRCAQAVLRIGYPTVVPPETPRRTAGLRFGPSGRD